ncbi:MAG: glycosyltransferase family 2 protein [Lachnospiraceae bacterium]|nr:glycosyltransferase [Robinsoniella sp.]MDY3766524.1 glycosyltransferase family 2 protein [Lachnospiraceae bacterium]
MSETPKVTIVIPAYNREETIERCLDSVLCQTYANLEILVIDDGSVDRTPEILREYEEKDTRVLVITKENTGVSDSRNCGIGYASGEYIQFLDSDDWLPENATELFVSAIQKNDSDMVIADYYRVRGHQLYQSGAIEEPGTLSRTEFAEIMIDKASDFYYGVVWNKFYRREILMEQEIRFSEDLQWCEDFLFNLDYLRYAAHIEVIKEPVYYYVKTKGSLVNTQTTPVNVIKTKMRLYEYYKDLYESLDLYEDNKLKIQMFLVQAARDKKQRLKKAEYPPQLLQEESLKNKKVTKRWRETIKENRAAWAEKIYGNDTETIAKAQMEGIRIAKEVMKRKKQGMEEEAIAGELGIDREIVHFVLEEE